MQLSSQTNGFPLFGLVDRTYADAVEANTIAIAAPQTETAEFRAVRGMKLVVMIPYCPDREWG